MAIPTRDEQQHAADTLTYIRQTMETASTYTAVSGWGLVAVGAIGLVASWMAWAAGSPTPLEIWIPAALVAVAASGVGNAAKAKRLRVPLWSGSFRKMAWGLAPALLTGAVLTLSLSDAGAQQLIPGTWLAVYGAGVAASGVFSVRALRWMGLVLLALGAAGLLRPDAGLVLLALGFGGVHVGFGLYIVSRHGG